MITKGIFGKLSLMSMESKMAPTKYWCIRFQGAERQEELLFGGLWLLDQLLGLVLQKESFSGYRPESGEHNPWDETYAMVE